MSDNYNDRDHLSSGSTSSDIFGSNSSDKTENSFDYRSSNSEAQFDSGSSYAFTSENTSKPSKRKVNIILRSAVAILAVAVLCTCGVKVYKFLSVTKDELVAEYTGDPSRTVTKIVDEEKPKDTDKKPLPSLIELASRSRNNGQQ